jgi:tRNA/rRNA methyltransferase
MNEVLEIPAAAPAIILVEPQLGENIGTTARAMLNCGLDDLRLVNPRDGWPNPSAWSTASGADRVLDNARVFSSVPAAVGDLQRLFATTARHRDMAKHEITPSFLATEMRAGASRGERSGILFGPERTGLSNDDVARADALVVVPLNREFTSLNLAQAVLLIGWEWWKSGDSTAPRQLIELERRATQGELQAYLDRLESTLEVNGFFRTPELRLPIWRKLTNLLHRAEPSEQEIRLLHGVLSALEGKRQGTS